MPPGCCGWNRASGHLADLLISSVAGHYGSRALAVIMTGRLDDGAAGVLAPDHVQPQFAGISGTDRASVTRCRCWWPLAAAVAVTPLLSVVGSLPWVAR